LAIATHRPALATERDVHLLLSQKGAKVLNGALEVFIEEYEDIEGILAAIRRDLSDQIEQPKKKSTKKKGQKR
jgi:hypothetical protein